MDSQLVKLLQISLCWPFVCPFQTFVPKICLSSNWWVLNFFSTKEQLQLSYELELWIDLDPHADYSFSYRDNLIDPATLSRPDLFFVTSVLNLEIFQCTRIVGLEQSQNIEVFILVYSKLEIPICRSCWGYGLRGRRLLLLESSWCSISFELWA